MSCNRACVFVIVSLVLVSALSIGYAEFPGKISQWHGYERHDFQVTDRACLVVVPKKAAPGMPWIWRARFFGHEPQVDQALLQRGYHLAYCDVANLYGSPRAVAHGDAFFRMLTEEHGLAKKVVLEGMSRGGLFIYNWASKNPDQVACIYGDAPVCDLRSWPLGRGKGKGHAGSWKGVLQAYGRSNEAMLEYAGYPVDNLKPLALAGVPVLHVVGEADDVVPVEENSDVIEKRYRQLGGSIEVIRKPGIGHHPHSLKDPTPIVEFITRHTEAALRSPQAN